MFSRQAPVLLGLAASASLLLCEGSATAQCSAHNRHGGPPGYGLPMFQPQQPQPFNWQWQLQLTMRQQEWNMQREINQQFLQRQLAERRQKRQLVQKRQPRQVKPAPTPPALPEQTEPVVLRQQLADPRPRPMTQPVTPYYGPRQARPQLVQTSSQSVRTAVNLASPPPHTPFAAGLIELQRVLAAQPRSTLPLAH